jgi:hypothetical protein
MSGMSKRTNIEAEVGDITLGNIQIRDGRGNAFLMDVDPDPTLGPAIESAYVQDVTLHGAIGPIPVANSIQGGNAVPVASTTLTVLAGLGAGQALLQGIVFQAMIGNAGPIAVGPVNTVNPTAGAEEGAILQPGQSVPLPFDNTDNIFVRSTNAADRLTWWGG